jgi:hypothetical protein
VALILTLSVPASAWLGTMVLGVRPIAEVQERAESGDLLTVQGCIVDVRYGSGSIVIVELEDPTGSVLVAIPEHMRRDFGGDPEKGKCGRVRGKWDHKHMDDETWGIWAQKVERIED